MTKLGREWEEDERREGERRREREGRDGKGRGLEIVDCIRLCPHFTVVHIRHTFNLNC